MLLRLFYSRNDENAIVGRQKRDVINDSKFENFHIVYGQEMNELLRLSEDIDHLEENLLGMEGYRRRSKRESVDHIGNVIMVIVTKTIFPMRNVHRQFFIRTGNPGLLGRIRTVVQRSREIGTSR